MVPIRTEVFRKENIHEKNGGKAFFLVFKRYSGEKTSAGLNAIILKAAYG
ncbi:hypothetical protein SAMN05444008_105131 [Cnuella takakiae]|uniref:Uncharacterized protein n=1 Tax=Cnuella takakiae TaxID=1302690 RepID=A0A1M4Z8P5_9BACT|nr:hypothetical protein SAMN05444008_105131 [Cnuella takakiae]